VTYEWIAPIKDTGHVQAVQKHADAVARRKPRFKVGSEERLLLLPQRSEQLQTFRYKTE
jgi:hypothetical protein